ncbi:DUF4062 domain-containing protein [Aeromonas veronii]
MAKPRIFVSSTYYDLKHVRIGIEQFINDLGYEPILFESGDIPFEPSETLDTSCYKEVEAAHVLVLIVGGRYGSASSANRLKEKPGFYDFYNSITKNEYEKAKEENIPIYIFVEKSVFAEYETYKNNKENNSIRYAHVDSVNVFTLLDDIDAERRNNLVKTFENVSDITDWLKDQWAGLFANYLSKASETIKIQSLQDKLESLNEVTSVLKSYTESLMLESTKEDKASLVEELEKKLREHEIERIVHKQPLRWIINSIEESPSNEEIYQKFECSETLTTFLEGWTLKADAEEMVTKRLAVPDSAPNRDYRKLKEKS